MALRQATRDEQTVRQVLEGTVEALEQDDPASRDAACEAVEVHTDTWAGCRDRLIEDLLQAEDWLDREAVLVQTPGAPVDQDDEVDFMPSHPTVALVQSAMEERLDLVSADAFDIRDPCRRSITACALASAARRRFPNTRDSRISGSGWATAPPWPWSPTGGLEGDTPRPWHVRLPSATRITSSISAMSITRGRLVR